MALFRLTLAVVMGLWLSITDITGQSVVTTYMTSCPTNQNLIIGHEWTLRCEFTDFVITDAPFIRFLRNDVAQVVYQPSTDSITGGDQQSNVKSFTAQTSFLSIEMTSFLDADRDDWTCEATGLAGPPSDNFNLTLASTCNDGCPHWIALLVLAIISLIFSVVMIIIYAANGMDWDRTNSCCSNKWKIPFVIWCIASFIFVATFIGLWIAGSMYIVCYFNSALGVTATVFASIAIVAGIIFLIMIVVEKLKDRPMMSAPTLGT